MHRNEAEEHLRIIRSLMEKATIYRAISAPTALVGGALAALVGGGLAATANPDRGQPALFFLSWIGVLAVTAASNIWFLRRDALRRGEAFVSPGMKMALLALLPSHLAAGVATIIAIAVLDTMYLGALYVLLPEFWCILYGMGLLAMKHFAPRSITRLGWAFFIVGLLATANTLIGFPKIFSGGERLAHCTMACTFGLFHLIYAACVWPRRPRGTSSH